MFLLLFKYYVVYLLSKVFLCWLVNWGILEKFNIRKKEDKNKYDTI